MRTCTGTLASPHGGALLADGVRCPHCEGGESHYLEITTVLGVEVASDGDVPALWRCPVHEVYHDGAFPADCPVCDAEDAARESQPAPLCTRIDVRGDRQVKRLVEASLVREGAVLAFGSYWLRGGHQWPPPPGVVVVCHPCSTEALQGILGGVARAIQATMDQASVPRSEEASMARMRNDARILGERFLSTAERAEIDLPERRPVRGAGDPNVQPVKPGKPVKKREGSGRWRSPEAVGLGDAF